MDIRNETKDLYKAAYLMAAGIRLKGREWQDGECYFIFKKDKRIQALMTEYWGSGGTVNARGFVESLNTLRQIIHE